MATVQQEAVSIVVKHYELSRQRIGGGGLLVPKNSRLRRKQARDLLVHVVEESGGDPNDWDDLQVAAETIKGCIDWLNGKDWHRYRSWSLSHVSTKMPEYLDQLSQRPAPVAIGVSAGSGQACTYAEEGGMPRL